MYALDETTTPAIVRAVSNFANNVKDPKAAAVFIPGFGNQTVCASFLVAFS